MSTAPQKSKLRVTETSNSELPDGWVEIKLGEAVESMKNGLYKPASEYSNHGIACLRMYNIECGKIVWKAIKRMLLSADEVRKYSLAPGDLLVNRVNSRELVGKTAVFPERLEACVYESKNIRVRLIPELANSDFVNYRLLLFGQSYFNYNSQQVVGMASISQPQIAEFPLPLPPRAEQDRIVSQMHALLRRIEKASDRIANVPKTLKGFRQAVLAAACSGKLTEDWRKSVDASNSKEKPHDWQEVTLGRIIRNLEQGWSPSCEPHASTSTNIWGVIKTTAVQALNFLEHENKSLPRHLKPRPELGIRSGDILITRAGPRVRVGICCLVGPVRPRLMICDKVYRFRADESQIDPRFLAYALNTPRITDEIEFMKTGISDSGVNLTQIKFQALVINVAPREEQREIVRRVEALFKLADVIEKRVAAATLRAERLTQAILAKAFRGELVPTEAELARREGREHESASMLLERIKAEGAKMKPGKSATRGMYARGTS